MSSVLAISGTSVVLYSTGGERAASRSKAELRAKSLAEAGVNYAFATLYNASDPTLGGAQTSNRKTFNLGRLAPGRTTEWVWKVSAVKAGRHTVLYRLGVGPGDAAKAETATGVQPGGSFAVRISRTPPNTIVTDSGEVVTIQKKQKPDGG